MTEQQPKFHKWVHNFLIYFFMWACAAFAVLYGIKYIYLGQMNGYNGLELALLVIVNALLILTGLFTVKARYDLAAFRRNAPAEILGVCIAGAVLCLANYWIKDYVGDDLNRSLITTAVLLVFWGVTLFRYYRSRPYLFEE